MIWGHAILRKNEDCLRAANKINHWLDGSKEGLENREILIGKNVLETYTDGREIY